MAKLDAERTIRAIWHAKADYETSINAQMTLSDYLYLYLYRKYGAAKVVAEVAYNLLYTLGMHLYDPDCNTFVKVGKQW